MYSGKVQRVCMYICNIMEVKDKLIVNIFKIKWQLYVAPFVVHYEIKETSQLTPPTLSSKTGAISHHI